MPRSAQAPEDKPRVGQAVGPRRRRGAAEEEEAEEALIDDCPVIDTLSGAPSGVRFAGKA